MTPETLHRATLARLVRRAQRGDADAFERLARPCGPTLYRVAASCLHGHDADAADAVQNALIAAWRNIGSLREPRYFKTWLIRITINACRSLQRPRDHRAFGGRGRGAAGRLAAPGGTQR